MRTPGAPATIATAAALATLVLAGCFSEILPAPPGSTLAFACAAIDPAEVPRVRIVSYAADEVDLPRERAVEALRDELVRLSGRADAAVTADDRGPIDPPGARWNETELARWARDNPFLARSQVTLRVFWLEELDTPGRTGSVPAPGTVAVAQGAVREAALRLGQAEADVARAVLLHFAGHALGATNRGIPVQDPALQEREGPPGHDADPASVLAAGWEDARAAAWAPGAAYDGYPDSALADWQAARGPGGVCP